MGWRINDMKLKTTNTYYGVNNGYLTSSKLKTYLQDPYYFYQLHISGEKEFVKTPSMKIGSAVDMWLTEDKSLFEQKYEQKVKRLEDPEVFKYQKDMPDEYLLTPAEYDKVVAICESVEATTFWKGIKKDKDWISQAILRMDKKGGLGKFFHGVSGKPDLYKIKGKKATIIDLKTAQSVDTQKFYYACRDYNYFFQTAMYQSLIMAIHPKVKTCESFIIATSTSGYFNQTKLFKLNQDTIELEKERISNLLKEISLIKEFKPTDLKWSDAEEI